VAAEEDGNGRSHSSAGEIAHEGVGEALPVAQVGEEAVFAGGFDAHVGEEDAGVDEGGVAERRQNFEELLDAGRFDEEP
jgi:hypothetical protein